MKKAECQSLGRFTKTIIICLLGVTVLNIIWALGGKPLFILNENQLLYLFSSMAQIIGGVFGLTLTAYVFLWISLKNLRKVMTHIMMLHLHYFRGFSRRLSPLPYPAD